MAKAISTVKAVKALLDGGYICAIVDHWTERTRSKVYRPSFAGNDCIGHITNAQLDEMRKEGVITLMLKPESNEVSYRTDKYGNLYYYYVLLDNRPCKGIE